MHLLLRIQDFLSRPPIAGILIGLKILAATVTVLLFAGIFVFHYKRKKLEEEFRPK